MVRRNNSGRERNSSSQVLFPEMRDQKSVVKDIRNYLAGQVVGITRDEALLDELLKCIFCHIELERQNRQPSTDQGSSAGAIGKLYEDTFDVLQIRFPGLFDQGSRIELAPEHVEFIDRALSVLSIADAPRDLIGDVYEAFIGTGYRGHEGQFFTPKNAVKALVAMISPQDDDRIIDPACGAGGFLLEAVRAGGSLEDAAGRVYGIDKDAYLARLARLRLAIESNAIFQVECADSLAWTGNGFDSSITKGLMGSFSLVLTNPP
ncbi:MAG TPA: N-6 DNA methylase, partial [Armatimonadota bacterium]|nr:N-6 DNA methylase [Armatimonadota bacterium]